MRSILRALLVSAFAISCLAQDKPVPISEEGHHHLVFENEYTRVFHVEVPPKQSTLVHQHDRDYVWVQIGSADIRNARRGSPSSEVRLKNGEVRFVKGKFAHKVSNLRDLPFVNVTIEIKKPSTRAFYGASWPGVTPKEPGAAGMSIATGFVEQTSNIATDAVEARTWRTVGSGVGVTPQDSDHPRLLIALLPMKCRCGGAQPTLLQPGEVAWIHKGTLAETSMLGSSGVMFVMVSFK